jgi:uncharacterized membrane protein YbhN (UPF0104 family)
MFKLVFRSLGLLALAVGFLVVMEKFGLLRIADILDAFHKRPSILMLLAVVQVLAAFAMMYRYNILLKVLGIDAPLRQVGSATFVSTAVGQWVPGSMAVVEVLRVGLMFGGQAAAASRGKSPAKEQGAEQPSEDEALGINLPGLKPRLAIASFADRLIGFLGILLIGFVFSCFLFAQSDALKRPEEAFSGPGILWLSSGLGALSLILLPSLVRLRFFKQLSYRMRVQGPRSLTRVGRFWNQSLQHIETLRHNVDAGCRHPRQLVLPLFLSMLSLLLTSFSLYLSALALDEKIDFFQIVCAYPLISLASLLPLGFAGIGGYQLIMASIFGLFSVSPAVVASAGVLQSTVVLVANTVIGLLYARVCSQQLRAIIKAPGVKGSL